MAIFKELECSITVNGESLPEYDCPPDHDASATNDESTLTPLIEKYVQCQPGQNFAVRSHLREGFRFKGFDVLQFKIYVDGTFMPTSLTPSENKSSKGTCTDIRDGARRRIDGGMELHRFRFSRLLADDSVSFVTRRKVQSMPFLGDIKVEIFSANVTSKAATKREGRILLTPKICEKWAKGRALDTFTSLDEAVPIIDAPCWAIDEVSLLDLYRAHIKSAVEALRQLGIVEKPLSERSLEDRDPDSLTFEEFRELLRRKETVIRQQEETEKLMKKRLRQANARHNLKTLDSLNRDRSPSLRYVDDDEDDDGVSDDEVRIVKRAKKDRKIEIVELD